MHNRSELLTISVIICAYTEERWDDLGAALASLAHQSYPIHEKILVIDHNPALFVRAQAAWPEVKIIENQYEQGLSGARNSALTIAQGEILAFMDEDAIAAPDWLAQLARGYRDPNVMGVGGTITPRWVTGQPTWFPAEFGWVVGCTYKGMPAQVAPVRNLIGCNMSFRREIFATIGGFRVGMGRIGKRPVGCEETELCIRAKQAWPTRRILYNPEAQVYHRVPAVRACWRYFRQRCFAEGISKAQVTRHVGSTDGLASERTYLLKTLPLGIGMGLLDLVRGQPVGLQRAAAIVLGFGLTMLGYFLGKLQQSTNQHTHAPAMTTEPSAPNFTPALVLQVELSEPLPAVTASTPANQQFYRRALVLVRLHSKPLGVVEIPLRSNGLSAEEYARHIWYALGPDINHHLGQDGLPTIHTLSAAGLPHSETPTCQHERIRRTAQAPKISVVIATRNRTTSLAITLDSLLASTYRNFEIIVVDNAPSDNGTADLIQQKYAQHPQVRYVREDQPGLAVAHNRGLQEINTSLVAFTDDDVTVDRHWLAEIVKNLASDPQIGCVTGMIAPAEIETPAQGWIEQFGFSKGFTRRIFDLRTHRPNNPLHPYAAGAFGSGANMAFRTSALYAIGGFDPALGAGSTALGGDDLESFFQIIVNGYKLVYEPAALVHHWHRRDYAGLRRQAYGYGVGLTAYLTKTLVDNPLRILDFLRKAPYGLRFALKLRSTSQLPLQSDYPSELTSLERRGMLYGPIAYLRSRSRVRFSGKQWHLTPDPARIT